jgi:DNA-directed RNA polymerase subunit RPC12/RpoP
MGKKNDSGPSPAKYWKDIREAALERAGYSCEECGTANVVLHAHHLTYERLGHELLEDLEILCRRCHGKRPKRKYGVVNHRCAFVTSYGAFPHPCYFCGEVVDGHTRPWDKTATAIHHLDGDQNNNSASNLVPAHNSCHARYHNLGENNRWYGTKGTMEGKKHSAATRKKMRESAESWWRTSGGEARKKISVAHKNAPISTCPYCSREIRGPGPFACHVQTCKER